MKPSPFILHDKSKITNCATTSCGEGSGEGKNAKKGEGKQGEAFTRISLFDNNLWPNGEEVKAKNRKTADARAYAREGKIPLTQPPHSTIGARRTRLARKRQIRTAIVNSIYRKTRHKHTHTTKNRMLVKKVQQKEVAANILFKEKLYFCKKPTCWLFSAHSAAPSRSPAVAIRAATNGTTKQRLFFNPSIHPDT